MDAGFYDEDQAMKCPICKHGNTQPRSVSITLERGTTTIVFHQVPSEVCENCGEEFHSAKVTEALLMQAETAVAEGVEIEVRRFAQIA
jgi:YgiT-type zinc finger domain-containing protein